MRRSDPEVHEHLRDLPADVVDEVRTLFAKCFVTSSWDGERVFGHTKDEDVVVRLNEGWPIPLPQVDDEEPSSILLKCARQGTHMRGETTYYEFGISTALTFVVREIIDAKAAA
jgi:hypothetical protein